MLQNQQKVLLIIDDEPLVTDLVQQFMSRRGFQVYTASNGREALALLDTTVLRPDLIMTDIRMPDMDGAELAHALHQRMPEIPVLVATGQNADLQELALPPNVIGAVQKPYQNRVLYERIREIIDPAGQTDTSS